MPRKRTNKPRRPTQKRGIRTRDKLLDAAVEVYSEVGFQGASVEKLTHRAGVAVGSFYMYFEDQLDLFLAALDRYIGQMQAVLEEYIRQFPLSEDLRFKELESAVEVLIEVHAKSPGLLRESMRMFDHPEVKARFDQTDTLIINWIEDWLTLHSGLSPDDCRTASFVMYHAVEGVIHRLVMDGGDVESSQVARFLVQMLSAFIESLGGFPARANAK